MAFNNDKVILENVLNLIKTFNISHVIESGTYLGWTTEVLAQILPDMPITTIENHPQYFAESVKILQKYDNIKIHNGNSPNVLSDILPYIKNHIPLFYLDAHTETSCPLNEEMVEISKVFKDNCCIVIDDFKVPNINYLTYDHYKGIPLDMNFIKPSLPLVFSDPFIYFNDKSNRSDIKTGEEQKGVGKIYIFPRIWLSKFSELPFTKVGDYYYNI
jgi:hypothetical protein